MEVWLLLLGGSTHFRSPHHHHHHHHLFLIHKRGELKKRKILKGIRVSGLNEVIWRELLSLLSELKWIKSPNQSPSLLHSTLTAAQLQIIRWRKLLIVGIKTGERNFSGSEKRRKGGEKGGGWRTFLGVFLACSKSNQKAFLGRLQTATL